MGAATLRIPVQDVADGALVDVVVTTPSGEFRRKAQLDRDLELPLAWFRWGHDGRTPRWERAERVELRFRDPGRARIGAPAYALGPGGVVPSGADLAALLPGPARVLETPFVVLVTDVPELDLDALARHLGEVDAWLRQDLRFLPAPAGRPALVVPARGVASFLDAYGDWLAVDIPATAHQGYTVLGVAVAGYDPAQGAIRPVYTHEFTHAWVDRRGGVPHQPQSWLLEGLAARTQLQFHADATGDAAIGDLDVFLSGGAVENRHGGYLRAARVVGALLDDPRLRDATPGVFADMAADGDAALGPRLGAFGLDAAGFAAVFATP